MDILIIEDQRDQAEFICKLIRRQFKTAEFTVVGTVADGLAMANTKKMYGIAVVDLLLAEDFSTQHLKSDQIHMIDGVRVSEQIFDHGLCCRFLFITASDQINLLEEYDFGGRKMERQFLKKTDEEYPENLVDVALKLIEAPKR